jgi:tRNA-intron endonuclease
MSTTKFTAYLVEKRLIIWDPKEGSELFKLGYYGKPLGIPKPKSPEFDVPLLLDLMEGVYLAEKGKLQIYEGESKMTRRELVKRAKQIYKDFDLKYRVYRDLREHSLIVQPGIKFGCDFAVYERGPGIDHAPFLIQVKNSTERLDAIEIVRAGRLATTVRKRFIIAMPTGRTGNIDYMMFKWWKA